ncbi:vWA domain-containing protein [Achromobacter sp. PAB15]|uniref:vWA domain-containing protein n=1 Tax=Achromobacter sp. PAB15 TaxID=3233048 RepID=UPI003F937E3B
MWRLDYPWLLILLPLGWLAYRYLPAYVQRRGALRIPFFESVARTIGQSPQRPGVRRDGWQLALNVLVWALLVLALARPERVEPPLEHRQPVRDLMLALDISQSMETQDFVDPSGQRKDRLSGVKAVVADFIARRKDDRLGLIVFGTAAYPQAPLTQDHATLSLLLDQVTTGMAGPNTAIGDAIGVAIKQLEQAKERDKVLILLTDGNDTGSAVPPDRAASMAADRHITVHTIGIGNPQAQGEDKVDFAALERIAKATGGRFFSAQDQASLQQVYATLDHITPHEVRELRHQPKQDFFWIPLGLAVLLLAVWHMGASLRARWAARSASSADGADTAGGAGGVGGADRARGAGGAAAKEDAWTST